MPSHPTLRPSRSPYAPATGKGDSDPDSLDALVSTSRRMGRFWPSPAPRPEPAATIPVGVSVPSRAQRLVAGMADYAN
ncbi:hypothetical protein [Kitasatospora sp. McL0602]|uniref:hypothetical protein n=1 Tax=Kitasatospora sp. McL0602 TaxID=3439530 RepID=UPI003F8B6F32